MKSSLFLTGVMRHSAGIELGNSHSFSNCGILFQTNAGRHEFTKLYRSRLHCPLQFAKQIRPGNFSSYIARRLWKWSTNCKWMLHLEMKFRSELPNAQTSKQFQPQKFPTKFSGKFAWIPEIPVAMSSLQQPSRAIAPPAQTENFQKMFKNFFPENLVSFASSRRAELNDTILAA